MRALKTPADGWYSAPQQNCHIGGLSDVLDLWDLHDFLYILNHRQLSLHHNRDDHSVLVNELHLSRPFLPHCTRHGCRPLAAVTMHTQLTAVRVLSVLPLQLQPLLHQVILTDGSRSEETSADKLPWSYINRLSWDCGHFHRLLYCLDGWKHEELPRLYLVGFQAFQTLQNENIVFHLLHVVRNDAVEITRARKRKLSISHTTLHILQARQRCAEGDYIRQRIQECPNQRRAKGLNIADIAVSAHPRCGYEPIITSVTPMLPPLSL